MPPPLNDRDISWLAFNGRVLQEAADKRVPLHERIRFLAIFSSNLDEFFRVRVAALRTLLDLRTERRRELDLRPRRLLREIHRTVERQQEEFGRIFRETILPELASHDVHFLSSINAGPDLIAELRPWFERTLRPHLTHRFLFVDETPPFLENRAIHLVARIRPHDRATSPWPLPRHGRSASALIEIPTNAVHRFVLLPVKSGACRVMMLDDVVRLFLPDLFPGARSIEAWSVKLTRDADLHIDDEFSGDLLEKIREGLRRRRTGPPSRFLYDIAMPPSLLERLRRHLGLKREDLIPGGRYHNFNDFFSFPRIGEAGAEYPPMPPLPVPRLDPGRPIVELLDEGDILVSLPYQSFDGVIRMIDEAADDPDVTSIAMTIYRVAENSRVVNGLIAAARNGKKVTVFVEVKARFDEEANFRRAAELEGAGARVIYSMPGMKVHAKILVIERSTSEGQRRYGLFSTGNFNEKTALLYVDHVVMTADARLLDEGAMIFEYLRGERAKIASRHLMVAPFNLRKRLLAVIDREIDHVRNGSEGEIILKVNSLEDEGMIVKLYEAAAAGVTIRLIVRGICRLIPRGKGRGRRIEAISIVDRFLEHSRVLIARNDGDEQMWLASADWMERNLDRRIEVAFPVYDLDVRNEIRSMIDLQLADNSRARILDRAMRNRYRRRSDGQPEVRAQERAYERKHEGTMARDNPLDR